MPLPKLSELTPEQHERVREAHEAWERSPTCSVPPRGRCTSR